MQADPPLSVVLYERGIAASTAPPIIPGESEAMDQKFRFNAFMGAVMGIPGPNPVGEEAKLSRMNGPQDWHRFINHNMDDVVRKRGFGFVPYDELRRVAEAFSDAQHARVSRELGSRFPVNARQVPKNTGGLETFIEDATLWLFLDNLVPWPEDLNALEGACRVWNNHIQNKPTAVRVSLRSYGNRHIFSLLCASSVAIASAVNKDALDRIADSLGRYERARRVPVDVEGNFCIRCLDIFGMKFPRGPGSVSKTWLESPLTMLRFGLGELPAKHYIVLGYEDDAGDKAS